MAALAEIRLPDRAASWSALGFHVAGGHDVCLPGLRISCGGPSGSLGLARTPGGLPSSIDGLPVHVCGNLEDTSSCTAHPNGVTEVDHVVVRAGDWRRSCQAFEALGFEVRRKTQVVRANLTQVFLVCGKRPTPVIELVGPTEPTHQDSARGTCLWGITFSCADLDKTHLFLQACTKKPWRAVQPGRRITTLQGGPALGLSLAVAFMSPHGSSQAPPPPMGGKSTDGNREEGAPSRRGRVADGSSGGKPASKL